MAASRKVEEFDLKALKELKKSLICDNCKRPPRPGAKIYGNSCKGYVNVNDNGNWCQLCHGLGAWDPPAFTPQRATHTICHSNLVRCEDCKKCPKGYSINVDMKLTEFVSTFKLFNCINLKNGCYEELEAKDLETHERSCLFRDVTCPKLDCNAKFAFNGIMDHYQNTHGNIQAKDDVLEFKGTLKELKASVFVLNSYGKPFFPQFHVHGNYLHVWVVGHGCWPEIDSFEVSVKFFRFGWPKLGFMQDSVKGLDTDKKLLISGQDGMVSLVSKITGQGVIEFQMKIVSEKLDEIAKDVNVESGVDSETEEK